LRGGRVRMGEREIEMEISRYIRVGELVERIYYAL